MIEIDPVAESLRSLSRRQQTTLLSRLRAPSVAAVLTVAATAALSDLDRLAVDAVRALRHFDAVDEHALAASADALAGLVLARARDVRTAMPSTHAPRDALRHAEPPRPADHTSAASPALSDHSPRQETASLPRPTRTRKETRRS